MDTPSKEEVPVETKNESSNDAPEPKPELCAIETDDSTSTDTDESFDDYGEGDGVPLLPLSKLKHQWTNTTDAAATTTRTQTPSITPIGSNSDAVPDVFDLTDEDSDDDIITSDEADTSDDEDNAVTFTDSDDDEDEDAVNDN